jgi:hypothetical protein
VAKMISLGNLLGEFKKWLDGEESAAIEAEPPRVRREWEEFLIAVARDIEGVMQKRCLLRPVGRHISHQSILFSSAVRTTRNGRARNAKGLERGAQLRARAASTGADRGC